MERELYQERFQTLWKGKWRGEMPGILEAMGRVIHQCPKMLQLEFIKGTSSKKFGRNESK